MEEGPMPRLARLDAPGLLHHVIIRGIERRNIFEDRKERDNNNYLPVPFFLLPPPTVVGLFCNPQISADLPNLLIPGQFHFRFTQHSNDLFRFITFPTHSVPLLLFEPELCHISNLKSGPIFGGQVTYLCVNYFV